MSKDVDSLTWYDDFNPFSWIEDLWEIANNNESGRCVREFHFNAPISKMKMYDIKTVWRYWFEYKNNPTNQLAVIIKNDNMSIKGFADINGFPDDFQAKINALNKTNE